LIAVRKWRRISEEGEEVATRLAMINESLLDESGRDVERVCDDESGHGNEIKAIETNLVANRFEKSRTKRRFQVQHLRLNKRRVA
jgi:hypothetical protein